MKLLLTTGVETFGVYKEGVGEVLVVIKKNCYY